MVHAVQTMAIRSAATGRKVVAARSMASAARLLHTVATVASPALATRLLFRLRLVQRTLRWLPTLVHLEPWATILNDPTGCKLVYLRCMRV